MHNQFAVSHLMGNLNYEKHTFNNVITLKLLRNGNSKEASSILKSFVDVLDGKNVDGFIFLETPEQYSIDE